MRVSISSNYTIELLIPSSSSYLPRSVCGLEGFAVDDHCNGAQGGCILCPIDAVGLHE